MQKRTRSILDELANMPSSRDRENFIESRAAHVIQGAINLIRHLHETYDEETALELERRLINSIRSQDSSKFTRGVRRMKKDDE